MAAILFKQIGPRKLNIDAVRLELLNELRKQNTKTKDMFEATTRTWDHKVEFNSAVSLSGDEAQAWVGTSDDIYRFVDEGTRDRPVTPKNVKALAFKSKYKSKTTPNVVGSHAGGASGPIWFSKGHTVKGIKARKFSKEITKRRKEPFNKAMNDAVQRGAKKSWG